MIFSAIKVTILVHKNNFFTCIDIMLLFVLLYF